MNLDSQETNVEFIQHLVQQGRLSQARRKLELLRASNQTCDESTLLLVEVCAKQGDFYIASTYVDSISEDGTNGYQVLLWKSRISYSLGEIQSAIDTFIKIVSTYKISILDPTESAQELFTRIVTRWNTPDEISLVSTSSTKFQRPQESPIYLIKRADTTAGLFSYYLSSLCHIVRALETGHIPVLDFESRYFPLLHDTPDEVPFVNAIHSYFTQVSGVSVIDALSRSNTVVAKEIWPNHLSVDPITFTLSSDNVRLRLQRFTNVFRVHDSIAFRAEKFIRDHSISENTIGVSYRSSYLVSSPGHPQQPTASALIDFCDEHIDSYQSIFLRSDDESICHLFGRRYGNRVSWNEDIVRTSSPNKRADKIEAYQFEIQRGRYISNVQFIIDSVALSRCGAIAGARSGAVLFAHLMKEGTFKFSYLPEASS